MTLLRKLTQKNSQPNGEDDPMTQKNLKRTNKNEEVLEDSKSEPRCKIASCLLTDLDERMDLVPLSMCDGPPAARERLWVH